MTYTPGVEVPGEFQGGWKPTDRLCRGCGKAGAVTEREWESSCGGWEDYQYRCAECGETWWIEGIDS